MFEKLTWSHNLKKKRKKERKRKHAHNSDQGKQSRTFL